MISNPLKNLESLEEDMKNKGWTITSFIFIYKNIEYIVLVNLFLDKKDKKNSFASVKLHFMKASCLEHNLEIEANIKQLLCSAKVLREYSNINYSENLGEILNQFTSYFGKYIPCFMNENVTQIQKKAMLSSLSKSDSENPNKLYCYKVKRNPLGEKRSPFNEDKTKILRPDLFEYFKNDKSISFCYKEEESLEKTTAEIIRKFSERS